MWFDALIRNDPELYSLIKKEELRQKEGLEMIPSENYASAAVLEAVGSILMDKYAEGYPGKRYYGGNAVIDEVERLAQERAKTLFGADAYSVNVQPHSGSPANLAVYSALLKPGDTVMGSPLDQGGHLTHGSPVNISGKTYRFIPHAFSEETETLDYDGILKLARKEKPKLIVSGFTAYSRTIDFQKFHAIAHEVGAISMADISHVAGLIVGGVHPTPFPCTDIITTTTHKTLRGPRGAMIFSKKEFTEAINKAVFPGMQGGPHEHTIAGIAVALHEAMQSSFRVYAAQIIKNTSALAATLMREGIMLVSGGTDTHLILIDLRPFGPGRGIFIEKALEAIGVSVNKTTVPRDPSVPFYPSGIRLGTPALTSRGMRENDMATIGIIIAEIIKTFAPTPLPEAKEERPHAVLRFAESLHAHPLVEKMSAEVKRIASAFPVPGIE